MRFGRITSRWIWWWLSGTQPWNNSVARWASQGITEWVGLIGTQVKELPPLGLWEAVLRSGTELKDH